MKFSKFWIAAIAVMSATAVFSDYLVYWDVQNAYTDYAEDPNNSGIDFVYATIKIDGETGYLSTYTESGATEYYKRYYAENETDAGGSIGAGYSGVITDAQKESGTLKVELWDSADTVVGWQTYNISQYVESLWYLSADNPYNFTYSGNTALTVSNVVPEPTSGLLTLVGMALLALRRKQRQA